MNLVEFTSKGLYCPAGNFYIDPWAPVDRAVITHAHSDHARAGSGAYLCHRQSLPLLRLRLGDHPFQTTEWGQSILMNGVKVSLHPAGHVIGSSQVRLEYSNRVWVFSGDYKLENDGISGQFEPVRCDTFITETTFGLPIYQWQRIGQIDQALQDWVIQNQQQGITSVILAYSLGKAQRVSKAIAPVCSNLFAHGAVCNVQDVLIRDGWDLPALRRVTPEVSKAELAGSVVIAPPGADSSGWIKRFHPYTVGVCSGWMQVRGNARRKNVDAGFAMSDHADWDGLIKAVKDTGASKVFTTHGYAAVFSRYLNEQGIESTDVKTQYGDDEEETPASMEPLEGKPLNEEISDAQ